MPLPKTKSVGKLLTFLKRDKPHWSHEQQYAVALNEARRNGAPITQPKKRNK